MVRLDQKNEWREAFYLWRDVAFHPENYPKETLLDEAEKYATKFFEAFELAQKLKEIHDSLNGSEKNDRV